MMRRTAGSVWFAAYEQRSEGGKGGGVGGGEKEKEGDRGGSIGRKGTDEYHRFEFAKFDFSTAPSMYRQS